LWVAGLRRADVEREVILFETCVQPERRVRGEGGTATFKRALIGIGESAPIRDR
jgi:hypothetical protein